MIILLANAKKLLKRRFANFLHDENRSVLRDMFWIILFLLITRVISAVKEVAVAYHFGTSAIVDGYFFIFNLTQWPVGIFASLTSVVFIPYLVRLQRHSLIDAKKFQASLTSLSLVLGIVFSVVLFLLFWWIIGQFDLGLTVNSQAAALRTLPWVVPGISFALLGVVISNWLMSTRRHVNTLLESIMPLAITACMTVWFISLEKNVDVLPLAIGTLIGYFLHTLLLIWVVRKDFAFGKLYYSLGHWEHLRSAFNLMLLAQVINGSAVLLDQFFAVNMGEGILATYSYAQRIMALFLGLTATVIGRALLPVLSKIEDQQRMFSHAIRWASAFLFIGVLGALAIWISSEWLVKIIFQRGSFTQMDTENVAKMLRYLGAQLPFFLSNVVIVQALASSSIIKPILTAAILMFSSKFLGLLWFSELGSVGLAVSTVLMYVVGFISLGSTIYKSRNLRLKS